MVHLNLKHTEAPLPTRAVAVAVLVLEQARFVFRSYPSIAAFLL
jgi:hypothetical protein